MPNAPRYKETDLADPAMAQARRAITLILSRHEPWPAFVLDRDWTVLAANDSAQRLVGVMLGESRLNRPMNLMHMLLGELRPQIVNWPAFAAALLRRARGDGLAAAGDAGVRAAWTGLLALPDVEALAAGEGAPVPGPLCEVRFASQRRELGLLPTTIAFATPADRTLDGLRIEAFLPSDEESEALLLALAGGA
ncbi:MAG: transcriptional regulator [Caulobacterales bacterium]|nr:transcriptional regulator [Caulobacterales bacterium]